jgi:hypothetical protein
MASFKRGVSFVIAGLTCPCHLPIYLAVLGGTALGGFMRENTGLVALGLTGTFVVSLLCALGSGKGGPGERDERELPANGGEAPVRSAQSRSPGGG